MSLKTLSRNRLGSAGVGAFFRPKDIQKLGISYLGLQKLVEKGEVEKLEGGLYRLVAIEPTEFETTAMVASAIPHAIICLLSALRIHDIGTQAPHETWIALDRKARKPAHPPTKVRVVRFSGAMLRYGVEEKRILGVRVRITSPARTVVDCFRYRNKIGIDVALEALRETLRSKKATVDQIARAAEMCRAQTVMRHYLDALLL